ncbi:lactate racemase domain-containing protein [[Eubacterium] cellulosolvens]
MEIWIPYGSSEVGVGVKPENLSVIVKPKAQQPTKDIKKEIASALDNAIGSIKLEEQNSEKKSLTVIIDSSLGNQFFDTINSLVVELCKRLEIHNVIISWRNEEGCENLYQILQTSNISNIKMSEDNSSSSKFLSDKNPEKNKIDKNSPHIEASLRVFIGRVGVDPIWLYKGSTSMFLGLLDIENRDELFRAIVTSYLNGTAFDIKKLEESRNKFVSSIGPCLAFDIFVNEDGTIAKILSNSFDSSLIKSANAIDEIYKVTAETASDILVVSAGGSQYDNTLANSIDAIILNKDLVKKGGTIILVAECLDGYGNEEFLEITTQHSELKNIKPLLKKEPTLGKFKAYTLKELLDDFRLCLVSVMPDYYARSIFKFRTYRTVGEALQSALRIIGKQATITVVPHGAFTKGTIN